MRHLLWGTAALGLAVMLIGNTMTAGDLLTTRSADEETIRAQAKDYCIAFGEGDAKAVAAFWTERGEYQDESETLRGRDAIENAFAEHFKVAPKQTMTIDIDSIRFPARDLAVEEGTIQVKANGTQLPTSTRYRVVHVREDGKWKAALVREWGAGDDKLQDLAWLIGTWTAKTKDREVELRFNWNDKKTYILSHFTVKEKDKVTSSGTQRICQDSQTGRLRSWIFDDEGGHGQGLWSRDGNRWLSESMGVTPAGTETTSVNVMTRLDDNSFVWHSINRSVDGEAMPDTTPVKVTRKASDK
jgi:uncharacterized protein (TIGR02246 family)